MDQTKALNAILESADLIQMLEELANTSARGGISGIAGLRITLRNIREQLLASHDTLAPVILSRSRLDESNAAQSSMIQNGREGFIQDARSPDPIIRNGGGPESKSFTRRDLRATIEKVLENS